MVEVCERCIRKEWKSEERKLRCTSNRPMWKQCSIIGYTPRQSYAFLFVTRMLVYMVASIFSLSVPFSRLLRLSPREGWGIMAHYQRVNETKYVNDDGDGIRLFESIMIVLHWGVFEGEFVPPISPPNDDHPIQPNQSTVQCNIRENTPRIYSSTCSLETFLDVLCFNLELIAKFARILFASTDTLTLPTHSVLSTITTYAAINADAKI